MQTLAREIIIAICQATGGGLLVAGFAFLVCRVFGKLTAPVRFGLWWLVGAKFLIGLALAVMGVTALRVPVLKAEHYYTLTGLAKETVARAGVGKPPPQPKSAANVSPLASTSRPAATNNSPQNVPISPSFRLSSWRRDASRMLTPYLVPAVAVYLLGFVVVAWRRVAGAVAFRDLVGGAEICENGSTIEDLRFVAEKLDLRQLPMLKVSLRTSSPFVIGLIRPTIVLPAAFLAEQSATRQLALAHEIAHIRRGDLFWEVVPFLLQTVFWFLPPAHYTANEIASAREEACDLIAIAACGSSPSAYGSLLIRVAERSRSPLPAMAMAAPTSSRGYRQIKRRLRTLAREGSGAPVSFVWRGVAIALLSAQGTATILPLRPALVRAAEVARAALPAAELPRYAITDLGTLGGKDSVATSVNDAGQVVGTAQVFPQGTRGHAFLWDGAGRDLTAGSVYRHSQGAAIANNGFVAGYAYRSSYRSGQQNAFLWDGSRRVYLPPAPGYRFARAESISESWLDDSRPGVAVVGASLTGNNDRHGATVAQATLWRANKVLSLGTLGGPHSFALAVNGSATVVGKADLPVGADGTRRTHPFVWDAESGAMRDLGTLGGGSGAACAVSEAGTVVGYAQTTGGTIRGFVASANGADTPRDLGALRGNDSSAAYAVNELGVIVGQSSVRDRGARAVLWLSPEAAPVDLNNRLVPPANGARWHLETARGINAKGQIVGQGVVGDRRHAFLLTPI